MLDWYCLLKQINGPAVDITMRSRRLIRSWVQIRQLLIELGYSRLIAVITYVLVFIIVSH